MHDLVREAWQAERMNRRKIPVKVRGQWFPTTVARVLKQA